MSGRRGCLAMRLYRTILLLLPGDVRRDFGPDMVQLFADRLRECRGRAGAIAALWLAALGDILAVAAREWAGRGSGLLRSAWTEGTKMEVWRRDVRFGARTLLRAPGFTAAAVATLALGIGANAAVFSIVHPLLIRPLPYPDADRLVIGITYALLPDNLGEWKRRATALEDFSGWALGSGIATGSGTADRLSFLAVTEDFFAVLGVRAAQGRLLVASDHDRTATPVMVVTHELWQARFGAGTHPGEQTLTLEDVTYTVVGVLPADFRFYRYEGVDAYIPAHHYPPTARGFTAAARLASDVTFEQADEQFARVAARYDPPEAIAAIEARGFAVSGSRPYLERMAGAAYSYLRQPLLALFGAAAFVLLIACANVANLLAARATGREGELAVRRALGAGRATLVRQLLTESALLAALGTAAGLVVASVGVEAMLRVAPGYVPRADEIGLNGTVLAFAAAGGALATLLAGLTPALRSATRTARTVSATSGRASASTRTRRWGEAVTVLQIAMALVLVIGTTLFVRTYLTLRPTQPGFETEDRIVANFDLGTRYEAPEARRRYAEALLHEIARAAPVGEAAIVTHLPLSGGSTLRDVTSVDGAPVERPSDEPSWIHYRAATPDYMSAIGMRVLRGRHLSEDDRPGAPDALVINETAARRIFPDGVDPVGRTVDLGRTGELPVRFTVVGLAADTRVHPASLDTNPVVWASFWQHPAHDFSLVLHAPAGSVTAPMIRAAANAVDADVPVSSVRTFGQMAREAVEEERFQMTLMSTFGVLALLLAVIGCYGVLAFAVGQRTREMGIRIALGAGRSSIVRLVLGRGIVMSVAGVGLGLTLAVALTRVVAASLYGVSPTDPVTFAGAAALLATVSLVAAYLPARKAARVDPMHSLRAE